MGSNNENIDNRLKNSFDDFLSPPSEKTRKDFSNKMRKQNFFRFHLVTFNVYYLIAIIIGISSTFVLLQHNYSNSAGYVSKLMQQRTISFEPKLEITTANTNIEKLTEDFIEKKEEQINNGNIINTKTYSTNSDYSVFEDINAIPEDLEIIENSTSEDKDNIEEREIIIPTKIIYDTTINIKRVSVVDTIKAEVHQTVKIKRPRRKNKK